MKLDVVILAAGKGTRMYSSKPKVLHSIGGKAMLEHVVATTQTLDNTQLHIVVGYGADQIKSYFSANTNMPELHWVLQSEQLGTAHAVQQVLPALDCDNEENLVLVLYGDVPLIKSTTLRTLVDQAGVNGLSLLTVITEKPEGLGRIVREQSGDISAIVEEREATEEQKAIKEINSGIMVVPVAKLGRWLKKIGNDNTQGEFYLTDIVALAAQENCKINSSVITDELEVQGVNDKTQLAILERHYQMTKTEELMKAGVTIRDPARVDIRGELECGNDVEVDVNVIFEGKVTLGNGVSVGANTVIKDSVIADHSTILPGCNIDGANIGEKAAVGPYARIRPGTVLKEAVKIGNFVEIKNTTMGKGSKASHLAYIGDAEVGENVNIGAGTIFCNYDGVNKHKTVIGDDVFVGSNSVLIAPLKIADGAFIAAGSAINSDVAAGELAVARGKQRNISKWKRPSKRSQ